MICKHTVSISSFLKSFGYLSIATIILTGCGSPQGGTPFFGVNIGATMEEAEKVLSGAGHPKYKYTKVDSVLTPTVKLTTMRLDSTWDLADALWFKDSTLRGIPGTGQLSFANQSDSFVLMISGTFTYKPQATEPKPETPEESKKKQNQAFSKIVAALTKRYGEPEVITADSADWPKPHVHLVVTNYKVEKGIPQDVALIVKYPGLDWIKDKGEKE